MVTPSTLRHFTLLINNVNLWHSTKNSKKKNDYKSEIVNDTSIYNFLKVQKNWHPIPIFNNINMNKNPWLIVQSDDSFEYVWYLFKVLTTLKKSKMLLMFSKLVMGFSYFNRWKFVTNWTYIYLFSTLLIHSSFSPLVALTFSFFWYLLLRLICNTHQLNLLDEQEMIFAYV